MQRGICNTGSTWHSLAIVLVRILLAASDTQFKWRWANLHMQILTEDFIDIHDWKMHGWNEVSRVQSFSPSRGSAFLSGLYSQAGSCHVLAKRGTRSPRYSTHSTCFTLSNAKEKRSLFPSHIFHWPSTDTGPLSNQLLQPEKKQWPGPHPTLRPGHEISPLQSHGLKLEEEWLTHINCS